MINYENDCCDCATPGYPCLGSSCSLVNVPHFYCDHCGDEVGEGELYRYEGEELCEYCVLNALEVVTSE